MIKSVGEGGRSKELRFSEEPAVVRAERTVLIMEGSEVEERTELNIDNKRASGEGVRDGRDYKGEKKTRNGEVK